MFRSATLLLALAACTPESIDAIEAGATSRIPESSAEAFGVLALLHDPATTESVLDIDAALDVRAARSLIAHRNGPDGVYKTADDDRFDTIAEVDAQYYVGDSALDKLAAYAASAGFTPAGGDVVGAWEGVDFTLDQVTATLALANEGSEVELDDEVALDSRAVDGIFAARPLATMDELAAAYYVGASALTDLRDYVDANAGAGPWETCDTTADCAAGLVCMGELAYGTGIYCVDDSMYGDFTYTGPDAIPDTGVLTTAVDVSGLGTVPVDVVLTLDIAHPRPSDLVVTIESFRGYSQVVWDREAAPPAEVIVRAFPSDDMVNGTYWLHVEDQVAGEQGTVHGWNLYIVSNWD